MHTQLQVDLPRSGEEAAALGWEQLKQLAAAHVDGDEVLDQR